MAAALRSVICIRRVIAAVPQMHSLRAWWFAGTTDAATQVASNSNDDANASAASCEAAAPSSAPCSGACSASFASDSQGQSRTDNSGEGEASIRHAAADASAGRKRSWCDVVAAADRFAASSAASFFVAAAESDAACLSSLPALTPLLRSTSSLSSDISLISGRSVSPFTLSSNSDECRFDDDDSDGELMADSPAADDESLLFDLEEEQEGAFQTEEQDAEEDGTEEPTSDDGSFPAFHEHAAFLEAEAQYDASALGRTDFKLWRAAYDLSGKHWRVMRFPFGKAHGHRLVREQQRMTRKKRELARWPKVIEKVPAFYKERSYTSTVALQRAAGTCDDCARLGENTNAADRIYRRRRGCNCALKERRTDELQRRNTHEYLKPSRVWPSFRPELPGPYELTPDGKKLQLRSHATVGGGSCNAPKHRRRRSSPC